MNIVIIDYNAGNIRSVDFALRRMGIVPEITADVNKINSADKVIFPGVGEASTTMSFLKEKKLDVVIKELKQPVLGICLGLQLMCSHSEENNVDCLNIFPVQVKRFDNSLDLSMKVPHMGWNALVDVKAPLLNNNQNNQYVYFVHSYYAELSEYTIATCMYTQAFSAALNYKNFYAVQFHPEKSGNVGAEILKNFINL